MRAVKYLTIAYAGCVALVVGLPSGWVINRATVQLYLWGQQWFGVPTSVTPEDYATVCNGLLLAPLAAALVVLRPQWRWWSVVLGCALISVGIELVQAVALPGREASADDVVANTCGALIGAGAAALVRRHRTRRALAGRLRTRDLAQ